MQGNNNVYRHNLVSRNSRIESEAAEASIADYLACNPEYTLAAPLDGRVSNYEYRLTRPDGSSAVLKHAEPHAIHDKNWAMDMKRMECEHAAISSISEALLSSAAIREANVKIPRAIASHAYLGAPLL